MGYHRNEKKIDDDLIIQYLENGMSAQEISFEFRVTPAAVYRYLHNHNLFHYLEVKDLTLKEQDKTN